MLCKRNYRNCVGRKHDRCTILPEVPATHVFGQTVLNFWKCLDSLELATDFRGLMYGHGKDGYIMP